MGQVIILGSSNAVPDESHENTHLALVNAGRTVLVDCVSNPVVRLRQARIDPLGVNDLILTHFHPDHVSGVPLFLMDMWLMGRRTPLEIYGLAHTLERTRQVMELYGWENWPGFYPVEFHVLPEVESMPVIAGEELCIYASPVRHLIPTLGLRVEFIPSGQCVAYSCDTEPCAQVVALGTGADVLIHEAAGASKGHSSAAQAGEIARQAAAASLVLIHYPTGDFDARRLLTQAQEQFSGPVSLAEDFMVIDV